MKNLFTLIAFLLCINAFGQGQLQKEASGSLAFSSNYVMQLAKVVPADKYSWTPQAGVRTFAGVLAHIIEANYFFASKIGATLPAGVNMQTLEKELTTKEQIDTHLKQSYDLMIKAISNLKDEDMSKKVEFPFPGSYTDMSAVLISCGHSNEHLGQLVAYARMNGITPPWSAGEAKK